MSSFKCETKKLCNGCKTLLPFSCFHKQPGGKFGLNGQCIPCRQSYLYNCQKTCKACKTEFYGNAKSIYCSNKCKFSSRNLWIETNRKIALGKMGSKNPNWVGDKVGYEGIHGWMRRNKPKPRKCEHCNISKPYDLANVSGKYKREITDFEWLCRRCHMISDGRMANLKKWR